MAGRKTKSVNSDMFIERILNYRAMNRLSQAEFAQLCGLSPVTISLIETENGKMISRTTAIIIDNVLKKGGF